MKNIPTTRGIFATTQFSQWIRHCERPLRPPCCEAGREASSEAISLDRHSYFIASR